MTALHIGSHVSLIEERAFQGCTNLRLFVQPNSYAQKYAIENNIPVEIENKQIRRHLLDMGITRGVEIKIKKIAPMGDPIDIELRDYELCIRKADLNQIEVEVIK